MIEPNQPENVAVELNPYSVEDTGISSESKIDQLIAIAGEVKDALFRRTVLITAVLLTGLVMMAILVTIGLGNRRNGNLLVECTTPGTNPSPVTGNACWDRLHATTGTDNAIAVIVDNIYCDHRRAQAKLPPVPDSTRLCRDQTPPEVLGR